MAGFPTYRRTAIYSRDHFLLSLALGVVLVALTSPAQPFLAVAVVVIAGVGIDLDHFIVARYNSGGWRALRRCLRDPRIAVVDQGAIFDPLDVLVLQRLFSHVVIGGVLVAGLWLFGYGYGALLVGSSLYVHLLADLIHDNRHYEFSSRQYVALLDEERSGTGAGESESTRE